MLNVNCVSELVYVIVAIVAAVCGAVAQALVKDFLDRRKEAIRGCRKA